MTVATAPGKIILLGEHAVVYGRPAIAAPVWQTVATATVADRATGSGCLIVARDVDRQLRLADAGDDQPLALAARLALAHLKLPANPDWRIELSSEIPIAGGMGSGAALGTALVCGIFAHAGHVAEPALVSDMVYESERIYHGTPSGIDNTVIAYGTPIWFVRGQPPVPFVPPAPFTLAIADSGIRSPTKETVGDVRRGWQAEPARYEAWFDAIARCATRGRDAITGADWNTLGKIMDENQRLLAQLGVSSPPLDRLIEAARRAGASGAKLCGGGRGGNVIALVEEETLAPVRDALRQAGAVRVVVTTIGPLGME